MIIKIDDKEYKSTYAPQELSVEMDNDPNERIIIRCGNNVVDIKNGFNNKRVHINVYPYEPKEEYGFVVNDDNQMSVYYRDGEAIGTTVE